MHDVCMLVQVYTYLAQLRPQREHDLLEVAGVWPIVGPDLLDCLARQRKAPLERRHPLLRLLALHCRGRADFFKTNNQKSGSSS